MKTLPFGVWFNKFSFTVEEKAENFRFKPLSFGQNTMEFSNIGILKKSTNIVRCGLDT